MLSKCLAILTLLVAVPALGQEPAAAVSPSNSVLPMRQHGPMLRSGVRGPNGEESTLNWSGYAVGGGVFTEVLGSWIAPTLNCTKTPKAYSSQWVGMDAIYSDTLELIGTEADCVGSTPSYYAWYEFSPNTTKISSITVTPGDKMSATVLYKGSKFTLKMTNHTTGQTFTYTRAYSAQRFSAEWIVETPCCNKKGDASPLADFTSVFLGHDHTGVKHTNWAVDEFSKGSIEVFSPNILIITMVDKNGKTKAAPGDLSSDGSSFEVYWEAEK